MNMKDVWLSDVLEQLRGLYGILDELKCNHLGDVASIQFEYVCSSLNAANNILQEKRGVQDKTQVPNINEVDLSDMLEKLSSLIQELDSVHGEKSIVIREKLFNSFKLKFDAWVRNLIK